MTFCERSLICEKNAKSVRRSPSIVWYKRHGRTTCAASRRMNSQRRTSRWSYSADTLEHFQTNMNTADQMENRSQSPSSDSTGTSPPSCPPLFQLAHEAD